ncbi:hypothetical protein BJ875DRAFT_122883 [Amylocarpus encephaloides]|uniref:Integral membrane protein, Mpv17/PMP22 family n=1 Tax=Amylocarpus encephaloides TaxID=45428 RepID=A0A9P7YCS1_9HELO|nr:hypothetical protein BJ875DRAFT_122883 [Amylocarpus encephaloides]
MPSPIVTATMQAIVFGASSSILAQGFAAYNQQEFFNLDQIDVFRFSILGILTTPPNFKWQEFLERQFPSMKSIAAQSHSKATDDEKNVAGKMGSLGARLSVRNTVAKFFLDQTIGCWLNTLAFLLLLGFSKGKSLTHIEEQIRNDYWSMVFSSYKFWPLVTLTNLILIPVGQRILVGNIAGLLWGIYVNLITAG